MHIDPKRLYITLDTLLSAHAPSGAEAEMDVLVHEFAAPIGDSVWQDSADNIIIHIKGQSDQQPVAALSHKDEIALIVKRIDPDGKIRIRPLGGLHPWALGESPVELLARDGLCPGVLSIGPKHVSEESPAGPLKTGRPITWEHMWIETRLTAEELAERGIRPQAVREILDTYWPKYRILQEQRYENGNTGEGVLPSACSTGFLW